MGLRLSRVRVSYYVDNKGFNECIWLKKKLSFLLLLKGVKQILSRETIPRNFVDEREIEFNSEYNKKWELEPRSRVGVSG